MTMDRRSFLKSVGAVGVTSATGAGSLTQLVSNEKTTQTTKAEQTLPEGRFQYNMASHSLDFAERFLNGLINREYTGPHRSYASNIDSGAKFIHLKVWSDRPAWQVVQEVYIPLLKKARDSIDLNDPKEIAKHDPSCIGNNADYPTFAMHVRACTQSRIYNLKNYCSGKRSDSEDSSDRVRREGKYQFIKD